MPPFKPPGLKLGIDIESTNTFDAQSTFPSLADSLQISEGAATRVKDDDHYSVEISERDIKQLSILGEGASGRVYKALLMKAGQATPPRFVAVKRISGLDANMKEQMKKDIKVLMDVSRAADGPGAAAMDGLVRFEGAFLSQATQEATIVLEYMNGGSLEDVKRRVGSIPEPELSRITFMVLKGLFMLHKRLHIVHCDIKPANILLDTVGAAKVADFGISRSLESTAAFCQTFKGTATYMSPERINSRPYGFASDIWSLGVCVVECATGHFPYDRSSGYIPLMIAIDRDEPPLPPEGKFSPELRDFCAACLQKDPARRRSAAQLLSHPFILQHLSADIDMRAFMATAVDPYTAFDELGYFFAHQFYTLLSAAVGATTAPRSAALAALTPLYTRESVLSVAMDAGGPRTVARGRDAVCGQVAKNLTLFRGWRVTAFEADTVDCSVVPGGSGTVLLMVHGRIVAPHSTSRFAESFVLTRQDGAAGGGETCFAVAQQSMSLL
eukprot:jgi/Ulvmu1/8360/UM042_0066.1